MLTSAVRQQCETYLPQCGPSIGNRVVAKGVCVRVGVRDGVRRGASWFNKSTKKQKEGVCRKKKEFKSFRVRNHRSRYRVFSSTKVQGESYWVRQRWTCRRSLIFEQLFNKLLCERPHLDSESVSFSGQNNDFYLPNSPLIKAAEGEVTHGESQCCDKNRAYQLPLTSFMSSLLSLHSHRMFNTFTHYWFGLWKHICVQMTFPVSTLSS